MCTRSPGRHLGLAGLPVFDLEIGFDVPGGTALTRAFVVVRLGAGGSLTVFDDASASDALTVPVPVLPIARPGVLRA